MLPVQHSPSEFEAGAVVLEDDAACGAPAGTETGTVLEVLGPPGSGRESGSGKFLSGGGKFLVGGKSGILGHAAEFLIAQRGLRR